MKRYLSWSILVLCGLASVGCAESEAEISNSLRILEPEIDIGSFKSTQSISKQVTVINDSSITHTLTELQLSCGCLSSDFRVTEMQPGDLYTFDVSIFNASLGEGVQHGEIATQPPLDENLRFQVSYEVEPSTYLFPDNYLLGTVSANDGWPRIAEFSVEALDEVLILKEPIRLETAEYTYPSGLGYEVVQPQQIESGDVIKIVVSREEFPGGTFCDYLTVTVFGESGTMRFPVAISGRMLTDEVVTWTQVGE